jgi:hypothetical protein
MLGINSIPKTMMTGPTTRGGKIFRTLSTPIKRMIKEKSK